MGVAQPIGVMADDYSQRQPLSGLAQQLRSFRHRAGGRGIGASGSASGADPELGRLFRSVKRSRKQIQKFKRPFLCLTGPLDSVIRSRTTQVIYVLYSIFYKKILPIYNYYRR